MSDLLSFLSWYITIFVVGLVSLPITFRLFPNLTSRGYALARPLGLLIWGYFFWLLCSLGILQNDTGGVVVALLLLAGLSIWCSLKGRWQNLFNWVKQNKKTLITMEVLFFIAFGLWTIVRAANPDAAYTEKPMELAFINAILKSPSFPPIDPWLSGYSISYYYFGYVIISLLIRVSGVASAVAFNLSSSLWFGLTALAVYGIVFDLIAARKRAVDQQDQKRLKVARLGGFFGPFFVLIISCLEGVLEFFYSWQLFWKPDAQGVLTSKFWTWLAISELEVGPNAFKTIFPSRTSGWLWWRGSRVIQDISLAGNKIEVIHEFPFFSYLLSDLHPHMLAMPFVLLALGLCLNLFLGAKDYFQTGESVFKWLKRWDFWFITLVLGSLAFINTWDFPIYVAFFALVVVFMRGRALGWNRTRIWEFIQTGLIIGVTGIILYLPFYMGFSSQAGGILPSMEYMTRGVHFWIFWGALLIPIVVWLIHEIRQMEKPRRLLKILGICLVIFAGFFIVSFLYGILILNLEEIGLSLLNSKNSTIGLIGAKMIDATQKFIGLHGTADVGIFLSAAVLRRIQAPGTWITLALMLTAVWAILNGKTKASKIVVAPVNVMDPSDISNAISSKFFVGMLIFTGIVLTMVPEYFYLFDFFSTRMNTIFKFYFQAWILWGIAAAYVSVDLLTRLKGIRHILFTLVLLITILGGLAYPIVMLWNKTNGFDPIRWTLDGNAFISNTNQDEYAAMQWLTQQPIGVVAEAVGGSYSDYARVSTRTGMPTVLGWPGHEGQWRGGNKEVGSKEAEVKILYTSNDWSEISNVIDKYDIRYIYLGNLEKNLYKTDGEFLKTNLPVIYQNSNVTIFEIAAQNDEELP